jgi:SAM-dependent methyltransferase
MVNFAKDIFLVPLIQIKGSRVLIPEPEISLPKIGVTDTFLRYAQDYFIKYENYDYLYSLMSQTFSRLNLIPRGVVVDFGSGFGNTVIPLLKNYNVSVVAIDISPDLLDILNQQVSKRGYQDRCISVSQDAQNCYFKTAGADLVVGCAVLHHMINPSLTIRSACKVLKPGGKAIFFEPFELGHQILRLAYDEILREAGGKSLINFWNKAIDRLCKILLFKKADEKDKKLFWNKIIVRLSKIFILNQYSDQLNFIKALCKDIDVRTHREKHATEGKVWKKIDDKWLFSSKYFKNIASELGCEIEIIPLHSNVDQFTRQTITALESYGGYKCPEALPDWAWDKLKQYDQRYFSSEGLSDIPIEACVVITAP